MSLLPVAVLPAAINAFTEEAYFRCSLLSTLHENIGKTHTLLLTVVYFGLAHIFGPLGFALRYCGRGSDAVTQIMKLNTMLSSGQMFVGWVGLAIWLVLTLKRKSGVARWTAFLCPILTFWLIFAVSYVPAPLGFSLVGGWSSIRFAIYMGALAITYKDQETDSGRQSAKAKHDQCEEA